MYAFKARRIKKYQVYMHSVQKKTVGEVPSPPKPLLFSAYRHIGWKK